MLPFQYIYTYTKNGTTESGNGKRKFVFFGRQTVKGNRRLPSQQTCPSMLVQQLFIQWWTHYFYKVAGLLYIGQSNSLLFHVLPFFDGNGSVIYLLVTAM